MGVLQVVTNFVIYERELILCQGSFQSFEDKTTNRFRTKDGYDLAFTHSYKGSICNLEILYQGNGMTLSSLNLDIPINHTKKKWKKQPFGTRYELFYCIAYEN